MGKRRFKELALPGIWYDLQEQALQMRKAPTEAENHLWQELRGGKVSGLRFRRQHPIGRFIADFYCVPAALVVEVDGSVHTEQTDHDQERDTYLEAMGLRVLRFSNAEVLENTEEVMRRIRGVATVRSAPSLPLSSQGEGTGG